MSWLVERKVDDFETITSTSCQVLDCGALKFWTGSIFDPKDVLYLAPGQWISVCEGAE